MRPTQTASTLQSDCKSSVNTTRLRRLERDSSRTPAKSVRNTRAGPPRGPAGGDGTVCRGCHPRLIAGRDPRPAPHVKEAPACWGVGMRKEKVMHNTFRAIATLGVV